MRCDAQKGVERGWLKQVWKRRNKRQEEMFVCWSQPASRRRNEMHQIRPPWLAWLGFLAGRSSSLASFGPAWLRHRA